MADVIVGKSGKDKLTAFENKTQVYGLAGNDILSSNGKSEVLLVGGSGNDTLNMTGGTGTLSGGKGKDTFNLNYSAKKKISAVIEDIEPTKDKIIITYDGNAPAQLNYSIDGGNVIRTDDKGYFNLTLKGSSDASDYYEGTADNYIWDVLWITNRERENKGLNPLTLSQGLIDGASIRAAEIVENPSHERPDGSSCFTAVKKGYGGMGENLAWGYTSPEDVMEGWMNSPGHRANILTASFEKLGVGYFESTNWVQIFGGELIEPDTLSTSKILKTPMTLNNGDIPTSDTSKFLSGTSSVDYIRNSGKGAKIAALAGNDTVKNYGANVSINAGSGHDYVENRGLKVTILGGSGNDSILNESANVSINADSGHDYVENRDLKVTILGGSGNDSILNESANASINAGSGNDKIYNHGDNVSVQAAAGNNLIVNGEFFSKGGVGIKIIAGNGNDSLTNSGSKSLLDGGSGNDLIHNGYYFFEDWNAYYEASSDNEHDDKNKSSTVTIKGGAGNDSIDNRGAKVTINGGSGNDSVKNYGSNVSIDGGKNNDFIINGEYWEGERGGSKVTIKGGAGNDSITSHGNNSLLDGGSGNDLIYNGYRYYAPWDTFYDSDNNNFNGNKTSIFGGAGNDTIKNLGNNVTFVYSVGDGDDLIEGFNETSKLSISGGAYALIEYDNDIIVNVGKGNVTLKGAGDLSAVNIKGTKSATLTVTNTTPSPVEINSSVKIVNASSRTKAVQITGNKSANSIVGGSKNDTLIGAAGNDSLWGGKGNDMLIGGAGKDIFIYKPGEGTDHITDYASGDMLKILDGKFIKAAFASSKLTVDIDGGGKIIFDNVSAGDKININNTIYKISGKTLK